MQAATKTVSNTKLALATAALLVAGSAAYSAFGGVPDYYGQAIVTCYDDQIAFVPKEQGGCFDEETLFVMANQACDGHCSSAGEKCGANMIVPDKTTVCRIPAPAPLPIPEPIPEPEPVLELYLPDLVIQNIEFNRSSGQFTVRIINNGKGDIPSGIPFEVSANAFASFVEQSAGISIKPQIKTVVISNVTISATLGAPLVNGQTAVVSGVGPAAPKATISSLEAVVDSTNSLAESDETNNNHTQSIPLFDLTIQDVYLNQSGQAVVRIKNEGPGEVPVGTSLAVTATSVSGASRISSGTNSFVSLTSALALEQVFQVLVPLAPAVPRTAIVSQISATVDQAGLLTEANETNNTLTKEFPLPDLMVDNAVPVSFNLVDGVATVAIKNNGKGSIPGGAPFYVRVDAYNRLTGSISGTGGQSVALGSGWASGETRKLTFKTNRRAGGQLAKLQVTLDAKGEIAESDESNNVFLQNQPLPDLIVESATVDAKSGKFTINVRNIGTGPVPARIAFAVKASALYTATKGLGSSVTVVLDAPLGVGMTRTASFTMSASQTRNKIFTRINAQVDTSNTIVETNDNNNIYTTGIMTIQ